MTVNQHNKATGTIDDHDHLVKSNEAPLKSIRKKLLQFKVPYKGLKIKQKHELTRKHSYMSNDILTNYILTNLISMNYILTKGKK